MCRLKRSQKTVGTLIFIGKTVHLGMLLKVKRTLKLEVLSKDMNSTGVDGGNPQALSLKSTLVNSGQ